jgi:hypothetical protein
MSNRLLHLARPLAFILGAALSLLAIYSYAATVQMVIRNPALVSPDNDVWTAEQLQNAQAALGLAENFFAVYALAITLVFCLVFLACGWLILLRRSQDWFGLYLALLLLSWANGVGIGISMPDAYLTRDLHLGWFMWPALFLLLYLFPSGHITPRWARWFAWAWVVFVIYGLSADILGILPDNPTYFLPLLFTVLLVGIYAQYYRYRHASALERQQVKLVVFSLALFVAAFIFTALGVNLAGFSGPQQGGLAGALFSISIYYLAFMGVPVSIAVAVLRYRLWDVDIVVRRTLIYGALTLTLGLVFFGGVTLLQQLFGALTGTEESPIAIVISTLGIAALFTPLRRRIQRDIDRRFFRKKYNAEQTLAAFAATARDQVELESLADALLNVTQETMQPEMVSLWLKPAVERRQETRL